MDDSEMGKGCHILASNGYNNMAVVVAVVVVVVGINSKVGITNREEN